MNLAANPPMFSILKIIGGFVGKKQKTKTKKICYNLIRISEVDYESLH